MATLKRAVVLLDPSGSTVVISAGKRVPRWAESQITNPDLWASRPPATRAGDDAGAPDSEEPTLGDADDDAEHCTSDDESDEEDDGDADVLSESGVPPRSGTGGTRQRWADYAEAHGVTVAAEWKRDDIIGACERAGVPVG